MGCVRFSRVRTRLARLTLQGLEGDCRPRLFARRKLRTRRACLVAVRRSPPGPIQPLHAGIARYVGRPVCHGLKVEAIWVPVFSRQGFQGSPPHVRTADVGRRQGQVTLGKIVAVHLASSLALGTPLGARDKELLVAELRWRRGDAIRQGAPATTKDEPSHHGKQSAAVDNPPSLHRR